MIKKISCRVLNSATFDSISGKSLCVRQPHTHHYYSKDFTAADTRLTDIANLANHLKAINAILGISNEFESGQVIDFYA